MTRFYFIRHGESLGNRDRIFTGQTDVDLTETGYKQAEMAGKYLADKGIEVIYASDLIRAYNTGVPTAKATGLDIIKNKGFREIDGGAWEGVLFSELMEKYPIEYPVFKDDIGNAVCVGGESVAELAERVCAEFDKVAETEKGRTVAVFTHATPIRILTCRFMGKPIEYMKNITWVGNASISLFEAEDDKNFRIAMSGELSHLDDITTLPEYV